MLAAGVGMVVVAAAAAAASGVSRRLRSVPELPSLRIYLSNTQDMLKELEHFLRITAAGNNAGGCVSSGSRDLGISFGLDSLVVFKVVVERVKPCVDVALWGKWRLWEVWELAWFWMDAMLSILGFVGFG
ncbi:hypothetical protein Droror1_Dr00000291 [Drosera rotundifolia]